MPVYRQIVNQVKYLIASGRLSPGQELPTIRAMAERLVINPNTVVHAYAELEREGVIICRHGSGSYVADTASRQASPEARKSLEAKVDSLLTDAAHLNLNLTEILDLIRERQARLRSGKRSEVAGG